MPKYRVTEEEIITRDYLVTADTDYKAKVQVELYSTEDDVSYEHKSADIVSVKQLTETVEISANEMLKKLYTVDYEGDFIKLFEDTFGGSIKFTVCKTKFNDDSIAYFWEKPI